MTPNPNEAAAEEIVADLEAAGRLDFDAGEAHERSRMVAVIAAIIARSASKHYAPILERAERALDEVVNAGWEWDANSTYDSYISRDECRAASVSFTAALESADATLAALRSARTQQDSSTTTQ